MCEREGGDDGPSKLIFAPCTLYMLTPNCPPGLPTIWEGEVRMCDQYPSAGLLTSDEDTKFIQGFSRHCHFLTFKKPLALTSAPSKSIFVAWQVLWWQIKCPNWVKTCPQWHTCSLLHGFIRYSSRMKCDTQQTNDLNWVYIWWVIAWIGPWHQYHCIGTIWTSAWTVPIYMQVLY